MISVLLAIAQLCLVSSLENVSGSWTELPDTANFQLKCQQEYIRCVETTKVTSLDNALWECVKAKKPVKQ